MFVAYKSYKKWLEDKKANQIIPSCSRKDGDLVITDIDSQLTKINLRLVNF